MLRAGSLEYGSGRRGALERDPPMGERGSLESRYRDTRHVGAPGSCQLCDGADLTEGQHRLQRPTAPIGVARLRPTAERARAATDAQLAGQVPLHDAVRREDVET